ncbi:MAG: DMT family protein [Muribaculaceae bacterium]|nr:DMT family protein [Muribaculaceae bacterium]
MEACRCTCPHTLLHQGGTPVLQPGQHPQTPQRQKVNTALLTLLLLVVANIFMTFAWYGHLKLQSAGISTTWPVWLIILLSWGIALVEYCLQVPANRMGFDGNGGPFSLMQLKIIQEVITLVVFVVFSLVMFDGFAIRWNHIAAMVLMVLAVWLVFMK